MQQCITATEVTKPQIQKDYQHRDTIVRLESRGARPNDLNVRVW